MLSITVVLFQTDMPNARDLPIHDLSFVLKCVTETVFW